MIKKHEEIKTEYMDLLILILRGCNTSTKIAKKLKIKRTTAANRLRVLEQRHYISKSIIYNSRPFELTSKGKNLTAFFFITLKGNSRMLKGRLKAHKITWVMDITKKPYEMDDLLKKKAFVSSKHNTWYKYTKKYEDMKIVFNPNKVFIYIDGFYIDNPLEYYDIAVEKVRKAKNYVEGVFKGLTLGDPLKQMVVASNHIVKEYGPLARKFYEESIKSGSPIIYHGSHLNVDFSDGPPEEETVDPITAPMDMHNLGEFFNDWLQDPIQVKELHNSKKGLETIKKEVFAKLEKGDQDFNQIITKLNTSHSQLIKLKDNQADIIAIANKSVQGNEELKGYLAKFFLSQEVFSTAMHEHVALIKTLQILAEKNKEGLESGLISMGNIVSSAFGEIKTLVTTIMDASQSKEERTLEALEKRHQVAINNVQKQQMEGFKIFANELTPWYRRIYNFAKEKLSKR
jgi:DNA-binding Lrp family transcriptional regulator